MAAAPWELTQGDILSDSEVATLLAQVRKKAARGSDRGASVNRVIIETLLMSGLRCSEFCLLRLGDLKISPRGAALVVRGKGGGRSVALPSRLSGLLQEFVRDVRPRLLKAGAAKDDPLGPLFPNERGNPYERTGLYRRVVAILSAAGLGSKARVQLLRHTYGYLAYKRTGGNLLFVQRQLGHAHPMITAVYADLVRESYQDLADMTASDARRGEKPQRAARSRRSKIRS